MVQFSLEEWHDLKSQIVASKSDRGSGKARTMNSSQFVMSSKKHRGTRYQPFAFTEQGVAMLSSVLRSQRAIDVNIAIMRAFVLVRQHLTDYRDLRGEIRKLEREMNKKFKNINEAISYLLSPKSKAREIGFKQKGRRSDSIQ